MTEARDAGVDIDRFEARRGESGAAAFEVVGPAAEATAAANEFLGFLGTRGRSFHTRRAYAFGLAHFLSWLAGGGRALAEVRRETVAAYILDFKRGEKGGAVRVDPRRAGRVNARTRKPAAAAERQPRTVNQRLTVLRSFFAFLVERDERRGAGPWCGRENPVPLEPRGRHGMPGRDAPPRGRRAELRERVPRTLPPTLEPGLAEELIGAACSWRDRAILTLLWRTGQRIGDWADERERHGVLGMRLADLDRRAANVVVRLKGARDEHRVPVGDDFWRCFSAYVAEERGLGEPHAPAWATLRGGRGRPLRYATFESSLRYVGRKVGANVNAHMFRHSLAQALVETSGLKVAQEVLGHRHLSSTADAYARVDFAAMVRALERAQGVLDGQGVEHKLARRVAASPAERYAFPYDPETLAELDRIAVGGERPGR